MWKTPANRNVKLRIEIQTWWENQCNTVNIQIKAQHSNFKHKKYENYEKPKFGSPTPTLPLSLSSLKTNSSNHSLHQTIIQCFNSKPTKPDRNPSGRSWTMTQNVSSCRGFSFRPKFCFDPLPGKVLLVRALDTKQRIVSTSHFPPLNIFWQPSIAPNHSLMF